MDLISWFQRENGTVDTASMTIGDIPGQGRGAIALQDISEGHTLFAIPRPLTLSMRTSRLPSLMGDAAWKSFQLNKGWAGLILCMMWEESRGAESKWSGYFDALPKKFNTPMFWPPEELKELEGTAVPGILNDPSCLTQRKSEKKMLNEIIMKNCFLRYKQTRPDLFEPKHLPTIYSLKSYHLMGSTILSRSFNVKKWEGDEDTAENETKEEAGGQDNDQSMDIDEVESGEDVKPVDDNEDEDEDDPSDVAMVPMADMLNARELILWIKAKLFYESLDLKMVTTKAIKTGEQIFNTYGDPPNSELLRKYGHVDLIPLPGISGREGNPADVVEVSADVIVEVISAKHQQIDTNTLKERIDWWLEEGGDDVFVLESDLELPEALISFIKLLLLASPEWEKIRSKGKPPKPKLDPDSKVQILPLVLASIEKRLAKYPTTLEYDESLLSGPGSASLSDNVRNAVLVRLGEKHILIDYAKKWRAVMEEAKPTIRSNDRAEKKGKPVGEKKRKRGDGDAEGEENTGRRSRR